MTASRHNTPPSRPDLAAPNATARPRLDRVWTRVVARMSQKRHECAPHKVPLARRCKNVKLRCATRFCRVADVSSLNLAALSGAVFSVMAELFSLRERPAASFAPLRRPTWSHTRADGGRSDATGRSRRNPVRSVPDKAHRSAETKCSGSRLNGRRLTAAMPSSAPNETPFRWLSA